MAEKLCQLKKKGGGGRDSDFCEAGHYIKFRPTPSTTDVIPDVQATLISSGQPFIVLNTANKPAQIYCTYVTTSGSFRIWTVTDGVPTNLGELVNQWVNVTCDFVIVEGNISINLQFKWV